MAEKDPLSIERLQTLVRATCLRRMKEKILSLDELRLPSRSEKVHEVQLHKNDQHLYDYIKTYCAKAAAGVDDQPVTVSSSKSKAKNILSIINALRLICDHGEQLLPDGMKQHGPQNSSSFFRLGMKQIPDAGCSSCDGEIDSSVSMIKGEEPICANCVASEGGSQIVNSKIDPVDKIMPTCRPSAKVLALLRNLKHDQTAAQSSDQTAAQSSDQPRKRHVSAPTVLTTEHITD